MPSPEHGCLTLTQCPHRKLLILQDPRLVSLQSTQDSAVTTTVVSDQRKQRELNLRRRNRLRQANVKQHRLLDQKKITKD